MTTNVKTLIEANANIVQVTELNVGDIYRRLEKESSNDYTTAVGRVLDIKYNGQDAYVRCLEINPPRYGSYSVKEKVFGTDSDIVIFTCMTEEFMVEIERCKSSLEKEINDSKQAIQKHEQTLRELTCLEGELL